eukprot:351270-Chlamydomonas_euryale.AAC.2
MLGSVGQDFHANVCSWNPASFPCSLHQATAAVREDCSPSLACTASCVLEGWMCPPTRVTRECSTVHAECGKQQKG